MINNFGDFVGAVADYIEKEYDPDEFQNLSDNEKWTIRSMIDAHYNRHDSVSNVANVVINYLRLSRQYIKGHPRSSK